MKIPETIKIKNKAMKCKINTHRTTEIRFVGGECHITVDAGDYVDKFVIKAKVEDVEW
jgi:hypothetical protein